MKSPIKQINPEQILEILQKCYTAAIDGLPGAKSCEELAYEYLQKYQHPDIAAKKLISKQITKSSASGFVTSLGGLITMPVGIPANIISVIYIQIRMIASIAAIGGYDVNDDEVETMVFLCLAKHSITDTCKSAGINITNKMATNIVLSKIPGSALAKINKAVGFRLITKTGTTGVINLGKIVPFAGGIIGAGIDFIDTRLVGQKAYKTFILNKID